MRFNCGPTVSEEIAATEEWHRFFVVWPRRMGTTRECRWLEWVERKGKFETDMISIGYWVWEFRPLVKGDGYWKEAP